ncbi:MAG: hypothetical protein ACKVTZ_03055 [Bacteroidia bacterium]
MERITPAQAALWQKIQDFAFDAPHAAYPFSVRLADEQGWSMKFTERVLEEYRKFLFLSAVAGHIVSPSETIDEAWHLHLIYSESYHDFCQNVLRTTLHHLPSKGGQSEKEKYNHFHLQTKESYAQFFGENPPSDIWEDKLPTFDFAYLRNDNLYFFLQRPVLTSALLISGLTVLFYQTLYSLIFSLKGMSFVLVLLVLFGISLAVIWLYRLIFMPTIQADMNSLANIYELDEYETAALNPSQPFDKQYTAFVLANLKQKEALTIDKKGAILAKDAFYQPEQVREMQIWEKLEVGAKLPALKLSSIQTPDFQRIKKLSAKLQEKIERYYPMLAFKWLPISLSCVILALGVTRLIMGIENGKPIGFLLLTLAFMIIGILVMFVTYFYSANPFEKTEALATQQNSDYLMIAAVMMPISDSSGGDGGGGSCGGGGCGGGGCGGCGG